MNAEFPVALEMLFEPHRFKVLYGGRDGAKSWSIARALLILGRKRKLFIVCGRELMNSISESVHRVLSNQIENLGLGAFYSIGKAKITGLNGTEFVFVGLKNNPDAIKSLEGADILWVEEAANVSKASWVIVIPTVRKPGSEIWVSFNPKLETDDTYQRFVVDPPPGSAVVKVLFSDNPWASEVLRDEREKMMRTDPDAYAYIWLGQPSRQLEGSIYAKEIRAAEAEGRIRRVAYDPTKPVYTAWDLGEGDATAIWFFQIFMAEYRFIDYLEDSGQKMQYYLSLLQGKGYLYTTCFLPWDACSGMLSGSLEQAMRTAGQKIQILPKLPVASRIDTARTLFANSWFDEQRCADGLNRLRYYRYGEIKDMGTATRAPLHDAASHGSDAFGYAAQGIVMPRAAMKPKTPQPPKRPASPWS